MLTLSLRTRSFKCRAASVAVRDVDESLYSIQNPTADLSIDIIESSSIVNHTSNGHGMAPFDANYHCDPSSATMPTTGVNFRFEASQAVKTVAINQCDHPFQQSACSAVSCIATTGVPWNSPTWDPLVELLVRAVLRCKFQENWAWLDRLHPDSIAKLVDILTSAVGISPNVDKLDLSDYPRGKCGLIMESIQGLREKMKAADLDIEEIRRMFGSCKTVPVGNSNNSDLAHCREDDPRHSVALGGSDNDSNPSPPDALLLPVPSPIPQEIRALVDAYIFGQPLTVIVSNERLNDHWALPLPREYGYVVMGFYRIIGVEVRERDELLD